MCALAHACAHTLTELYIFCNKIPVIPLAARLVEHAQPGGLGVVQLATYCTAQRIVLITKVCGTNCERFLHPRPVKLFLLFILALCLCENLDFNSSPF